MKMKMIIGKKQIILAALVLALGVAVYLNWIYSGAAGGFTATEKVTETKNYGDSKYVNLDGEEIEVSGQAEFFSQTRLSRQQKRDEAIDALNQMFKDAALTDKEKESLAAQAQQLAAAIEVEDQVESLIKAKGFEDCVVYIENEKVSVMVRSDGLQSDQVAQITDIVLEQTSADPQNISIVEVK